MGKVNVSEYLQTVCEETVQAFCDRNGSSAAFKSEVVKLLISLKPQDRVLLVDQINGCERQECDYIMNKAQTRMSNIDRADGISSALKTHEAEAEG